MYINNYEYIYLHMKRNLQGKMVVTQVFKKKIVSRKGQHGEIKHRHATCDMFLRWTMRKVDSLQSDTH